MNQMNQIKLRSSEMKKFALSVLSVGKIKIILFIRFIR